MKKPLLVSTTALLGCLIASPAFGQSIIKNAGDHERYIFEAEPHALVAPFDDFHPGVGFRGTFVVVDNGFVKTINNSIGVGFGLDWTKNHFRLPVVMQWNFFLHPKWSVFGEPGGVIDIGTGDNDKTTVRPAFFAGGRWHFSERITLTMRIGYPVAAVGVSFLL